MSEDKTIQKSNSWRMFNQISARYDFLNHFLSFGLDIRWRKALVKYLNPKKNATILDLATGTADVLLTLFKLNPNLKSGVGVDMANKMLEVGRTKINKQGLGGKIVLKYGNANQVPAEDNSFDNVTISFGIRNVEDPSNVLREMNRVLTQNGRALILEFSLPKNPIIKFFHVFYLRTVVPVIGWVFSGHFRAYVYLNQTIEKFPYGEEFCGLMKNVGFKNVKANQLLFGVATIYQGDKA